MTNTIRFTAAAAADTYTYTREVNGATHTMTKERAPGYGYRFACSCGFDEYATTNEPAERHFATEAREAKMRDLGRQLASLNVSAEEAMREKLGELAKYRYQYTTTTKRGAVREHTDALTELGLVVSDVAASPYALANALRWAEAAFEQAANMQVVEYLHDLLNNMALRDVATHAARKLAEQARGLRSQSTSPLQNLMARHELAAWGRWVDEIHWTLEGYAARSHRAAELLASLTVQEKNAVGRYAEQARKERVRPEVD